MKYPFFYLWFGMTLVVLGLVWFVVSFRMDRGCRHSSWAHSMHQVDIVIHRIDGGTVVQPALLPVRTCHACGRAEVFYRDNWSLLGSETGRLSDDEVPPTSHVG